MKPTHYHTIVNGKERCLGPDIKGSISIYHGIVHLTLDGHWCEHGDIDPDKGYCCYAIKSLCFLSGYKHSKNSDVGEISKGRMMLQKFMSSH